MFSGGDSSEGINSLNQLGAYGFVNQVAVTNAMAAGQNIDWAQLAQQWIQMRDNSAIEAKMDCNATANADNISGPSCNNLKFEEKGEADMDMDDEEQTDEKTGLRVNNECIASSAVHNNLNQSWFYSEGTSQIGASRSTNNCQWNAWPNREIMTESNKSINMSNRPSNSTAHIPSLLKMTVPHPNEIRVMPDTLTQAESASNMMDAAKRKGLPAWIREGLEKMEREKQKQLEKEQQKKDNTNSPDKDVSEKNILSKAPNPSNEGQFSVLDDESTDDEVSTITKSTNNETEVNFKKDNDDEDEDTLNSPVGKTYEQKLSDLMIVVRRTLTELLLETTNEEISKVADETIKSFKSKASSAQVIRKSALSTLTGKLGLAAYGDSSSEDNSDDDGDDDEHNSSKKATGQSESENDSEEEIRNIIRSKRRAFIKTSEEIEERVASAAAREEEKLKYFSRKEEEEQREQYNRKKQERISSREPSSSSHSGNNIFKGYEKDFGEITETKIQNLNGKRQRERSSRRERTTRFSDNKDKYVALPNAATFLTNMNTAANSGTANASLSNNIQRQNVPDINGLLSNYTNTGMTNVLNAADAALEKVLKGKASSSPEKQSRRHDRDRNYAPSKKRQRTSNDKKSRSRSKSSSSSSSSSSSTSSDSDSSSTSRSSHHSKYNHRSATKHKSHSSSDRHYVKTHKDHRGDRKYSSSSSSYRKKDRESTRRPYHRNGSSDSEDEYRRRHKYDSHYSRNSSHSRSYTSSSKRDRDREHSRSQSRSSYSSSSNRRQ